MKNVIVTGATSFIGFPLVKELLKKNYTVYAVVRPNSKSNIKLNDLNCSFLRIIECSMDDYKNLDSFIKDPIDATIHVAWNGTRVPERDSHEIQFKNYQNSIDLYHSVKKLGSKRFISIGSQAECGKCIGLITEEYSCNPITEYGKAKNLLCNELQALAKKDQITLGWLRLFSAYGPYDYEKTMVISSTRAMLKNEDVNLTLGEQNWNYIYIDDVINLLIELLEKNYESGIFNACSNENLKLKEFVMKMRELANSNSKLNFGAVPYGKEGMVSFIPSSKKVEEVLNYSNFVPFEVGYKNVLESLKEE